MKKKRISILKKARIANGRSRKCKQCKYKSACHATQLCSRFELEVCSNGFIDGYLKGYKQALKDEDIRQYIHSSVETPNRRYIYLFCIDPINPAPVHINLVRFYNDGVVPAECEFKDENYQYLPLFWIYRDDLFKVLKYKRWQTKFEKEAQYRAWASFSDYAEYKAKGQRKSIND